MTVAQPDLDLIKSQVREAAAEREQQSVTLPTASPSSPIASPTTTLEPASSRLATPVAPSPRVVVLRSWLDGRIRLRRIDGQLYLSIYLTPQR